jgi:type IV pilus assembly protein PilA
MTQLMISIPVPDTSMAPPPACLHGEVATMTGRTNILVAGYRQLFCRTQVTSPKATTKSYQLQLHRRELKPATVLGFTLMELLIVIAIILILMLMAVPTIGSMRKRANETSAVNSLRTIVTAEFMYSNTFPKKGFACTLNALSGDPASGPATADHAQLIESDLSSGNKAGYNFAITNCLKANNGASDYVKGYTITAVPESVGKTGDRGFCVDQNGGSPKYDPTGGTNCTQILQQ